VSNVSQRQKPTACDLEAVGMWTLYHDVDLVSYCSLLHKWNTTSNSARRRVQCLLYVNQ
jgi:hypothetical protein